MDLMPKHKLSPLSFSSTRLEALTDGIFAFAMTLLVLNLNAPELSGLVTNQDLVNALFQLRHRFLIFLLSFFVLASAWGVHHRQFSYIKKSDAKFMWLNMLRLLFVVMIPFSSVLVGNYPYLQAAAFFFSMNVFLLSLVSYGEWLYAIHHDFIDESLPDDHKKAGNLKNLTTLAVSGAASIISLYDASLGLWTFVLIPLIFLILKKAGRIT